MLIGTRNIVIETTKFDDDEPKIDIHARTNNKQKNVFDDVILFLVGSIIKTKRTS